MRIQFGDWQLRKRDANNWELYHRHAVRANKMTVENGTAGTLKWHTTGRYYQERTFVHAVEYAADWELRNDGSDDVVTMGEYIRLLDDKLQSFKSDFKVVSSG